MVSRGEFLSNRKLFISSFPGDKFRNNGKWMYMSPLWMEKFAITRNVQKLKGYYKDSGFKMFGF